MPHALECYQLFPLTWFEPDAAATLATEEFHAGIATDLPGGERFTRLVAGWTQAAALAALRALKSHILATRFFVGSAFGVPDDRRDGAELALVPM
jgi:hypothetical protein